MQNIGRDAEEIRAQSASLGESLVKQRDAITQVANRVETALGNIYHEREGSERQVQQLLHSVAGSAQMLRGAQEAASAQLNHLIMYLEERAKGMAEVTQIAGRQVAQTLQSLTHTEHNLRISAEQSQHTVQKLASSTDELGERLYGAVSLLRAGGKVLTETAEATQSRLNEAINLLGDSETSLRQILVQGFEPVGRAPLMLPGVSSALTVSNLAASNSDERLQAIITGLETAQHKLEEVLEQRMRESLGRLEPVLNNLGTLSDLAGRLGPLVERLSASGTAVSPQEEIPGNLLTEIKTGFEITTRSVDRLREEFLGLALAQPAPGAAAMPAPVEPGRWENILRDIHSVNDSLTQMIVQQTEKLESRLTAMDKKIAVAQQSSAPDEVAQAQLQQQAQVLSELASALGAIDAHMQEMETTFKTLTGASDGRLAS
jgi:hypothetical protein